MLNGKNKICETLRSFVQNPLMSSSTKGSSSSLPLYSSHTRLFRVPQKHKSCLRAYANWCHYQAHPHGSFSRLLNNIFSRQPLLTTSSTELEAMHFYPLFTSCLPPTGCNIRGSSVLVTAVIPGQILLRIYNIKCGTHNIPPKMLV